MGQTEDQYREKQRIKHNNSAGIELRAEIATSDRKSQVHSENEQQKMMNTSFSIEIQPGLHSTHRDYRALSLI
jgi:hypothetical protein